MPRKSRLGGRASRSSRSSPRSVSSCPCFLVPGWTDDAAKEEIVVGLVKELLELFGPSRCMFASNWHGSGASSNADYCDECQPTMTELYEKFQAWCDGPLGLDAEAQAMVFAGTAEAFYRI